MMNPTNERWLWLWYSPYGLGGVENFLNMITSQEMSGVEHYVAAVQTLDGPFRAEYRDQRPAVIDWTGFYAAYMRRCPAEDVCRRLCEDIARLRPKVVMINGCTDFGIGAAPLLRRLSVHSHIFDTFHIDPVDDNYLRHRGVYLRCLDGLISSNMGAFEKMNRMYPASREIPTAYIPYAARVSRGERNAPNGPLKLLYLGRLDETQKRVSLLPEVLAAARNLGARYSFTVAGDGPERIRLEQAFREKGLESVVTFLGYVSPERAAELLRQHDCMLNVSSFEGFSISVIEALAAGCVPICTRLPNMDPDALCDGETCLLCDIDRPLDMAATIAGLNSEKILRLSQNAMRAGQRYTPEKMALRYRAFVNQVKGVRRVLEYPVCGMSSMTWDVTKGNPWLYRTHPIRVLWRKIAARFIQ